jgi:hypothetical protein
MAGRNGIDRSREAAAGEAKRLLGLAVLTEEALFELAGVALGAERAARCLELARLAPLTDRSWATSAIAALIVGTRTLGTDWWSTVHRELAVDRRWIASGTPGELLAARQTTSPLATGTRAWKPSASGSPSTLPMPSGACRSISST